VEVIAWSFLLRLAQGGIEAALTLVIGAVTAGVLRRMLTPAGTRRLFGGGVSGLLRGWLAGMLLPVCSLGVIPVAREMRRAGVPGGTVLAFVLAAPLLNPISFLYGLTLAEPKVILAFAVLSLLLTTAAGYSWDLFFARENETASATAEEPPPAPGLRRIAAVFATAARELAGRDLLYYAIGIGGSALLSAALPFASLQHTMHYKDPLSTPLMTALAIPVFSSPLPGMMKIGLMFDHGNSIGAAFVLFALGIGTSLGTLAWMITDFGFRRVLVWFVAYVGLVVGAGYASEAFLYDTRKAEADHTHAFDDYSAPFQFGTIELPRLVGAKLAEKFGPLERPAVYALAGFALAGLVLRRIDRDGRVERFFAAAPSVSRRGWDVSIPGPVLGVLALIGLVVFSVVGAFVYYPDREYCKEQMFAIYAESYVAVRTGKSDEAVRQMEVWDQVVRKLEVGTFLREGSVTAEQSEKAAALREALEEVRDEFLAKNPAEAIVKFKNGVEPAYRACRDAYP
jgi:uncharacterized protein